MSEFIDRRKNSTIDKQLIELTVKLDLLSQNIEQRLSDNHNIAQNQFQHIDKLMEMHRSDNLKAHEDILNAFKQYIQNTIERYEDKEKTQNKRVSFLEVEIKDVQERIEVLENAPAKKALTAKEQMSEWVKTGLISAGTAAVIGTILALIRYDDLVKLIRGN